MRLGYRCLLWFAVGRAGGREDDRPHTGGAHGVKEVERPDNVIPIVFRGIAYRLPNISKGREVHDRANPVFREDEREALAIKEIREKEIVRPANELPVPIREVIEDEGGQARFREIFHSVAPDVSRAAYDKYVLFHCIRP